MSWTGRCWILSPLAENFVYRFVHRSMPLMEVQGRERDKTVVPEICCGKRSDLGRERQLSRN